MAKPFIDPGDQREAALRRLIMDVESIKQQLPSRQRPGPPGLPGPQGDPGDDGAPASLRIRQRLSQDFNESGGICFAGTAVLIGTLPLTLTGPANVRITAKTFGISPGPAIAGYYRITDGGSTIYNPSSSGSGQRYHTHGASGLIWLTAEAWLYELAAGTYTFGAEVTADGPSADLTFYQTELTVTELS